MVVPLGVVIVMWDACGAVWSIGGLGLAALWAIARGSDAMVLYFLLQTCAWPSLRRLRGDREAFVGVTFLDAATSWMALQTP